MTKEKQDMLDQKINEILDSLMGVRKDEHGSFYMEIYADYRDEMDDKTAAEILAEDDPEMALLENLDEWYWESESYYLTDVENEVKKRLSEDADLFPDGIDDEGEAYVEDHLRDWLYFEYPADHYLNQDFEVNIMIDTGDGNYDYVLNSVYPCWYGRYGDRIDDKAGIVWLAKTQGYNKTQLWRALKDGDMANPKGFLESMRVELANLPSHMSTVTFLVRMNLRQLIQINQAIKWRDRQGKVYDARLHPQCGYVVLDKKTMCGLYDPWGGGGSILEIELEKDVKIPIKYIRCALPDEGHRPHEYSIGSVYGMCGSAWGDTLKEIRVPKKVRNAV